jgi:hypothetical protein
MIEQLFNEGGLWAASACRWHAIPTPRHERGLHATGRGRSKPARPPRRP